jgi:phosphoribosylpyrophosphate synthetase
MRTVPTRSSCRKTFTPSCSIFSILRFRVRQSSQHINVLGYALINAINDLPIPAAHQASYCLSCIPAPPGEETIPRRLAAGMAKRFSRDFVNAPLTCPKQKLKNSIVADKIPMWRDLYIRNCVTLTEPVVGRLVVIVDDLYQSGTTMWTYAEFLKSQGAAHVIGLPCVKSLLDSDNSP